MLLANVLDFEEYLMTKLNLLKNDLGLDIDIKVYEEQVFAKVKDMEENTIYCVIKYLSSSIAYNTTQQPIQVIVLAEKNTLENTQMLLTQFANQENWKIIEGNANLFIKQQYSSPVVLNNFEEVETGYRSMLYFTGTLWIMGKMTDIKNLTIDTNTIAPITASVVYSMQPNTIQVNGNKLSVSAKSTASVSLALTMQLVASPLTQKIIDIMNPSETETGNEDFAISFSMPIVSGASTTQNQLAYNMKLISASMTTAPGNIPALELHFMG